MIIYQYKKIILYLSSLFRLPPSLFLVLSSSFLVLAPSFSFAVPHAMCIYHGQAQDEYGLPYMKDAEVILRSGTNDIVNYHINGMLAPGINFALYVHLDDGKSGSTYYSKALHEGDPVEIFVRDALGERSIIQTNIPPVGYAGEVIKIYVTAGNDSDHDGLPDEWEQELVNESTNYNSITEIKPNDDFDGDGESNWDEFRSGNFAFLDYDYFYVEDVLRVGKRLRFDMLSVPGKGYSVISSTNLTSGAWNNCPFSTIETGSAGVQWIEGTGDWLSFYVDATNRTKFFGLKVR